MLVSGLRLYQEGRCIAMILVPLNKRNKWNIVVYVFSECRASESLLLAVLVLKFKISVEVDLRFYFYNYDYSFTLYSYYLIIGVC